MWGRRCRLANNREKGRGWVLGRRLVETNSALKGAAQNRPKKAKASRAIESSRILFNFSAMMLISARGERGSNASSAIDVPPAASWRSGR